MDEIKRKINEAGCDSILFAHKVSNLLEGNYFDDALDLCIDGVKMFPYYSEGRFLLGKCYQVQDRFEDARREYETVISLSPGHIRALKALVFIYLGSRQEDNAHKILQKCALFDPSDEDVVRLLKEKNLYKEFSERAANERMQQSADLPVREKLPAVEIEPILFDNPDDEKESRPADDDLEEVPALDLGPDDLDIAYDTGLLQWDFLEEDVSHIIITESEGYFGPGADIVPEDSDAQTIFIRVQDDDNSDSMARKDLTNILLSAFKADENIRVIDTDDADIILTGTLKSIAVTPLLVQTGDNVSDPQISVTVHFSSFDTAAAKTLFDETLTESCKIDIRSGLSERNKAIHQALEMIKDEVLELIFGDE